MRAFISGKARIAALSDGDKVNLHQYKTDDSKLLYQHESDMIFNALTDTIVLENTNSKSALKALDFEVNKSDALILLLTLLDNAIPDTSKLALALPLNSLLDNESIATYLNGVMYSRPLPSNSISKKPECILNQVPIVERTLSNLFQHQGAINKTYQTFLEICKKYKLPDNNIQKTEGILVNNAVNFKYITGKTCKRKVGEIHFACIQDFNKNNISNGIAVIQEYLNQLKTWVTVTDTKDPSAVRKLQTNEQIVRTTERKSNRTQQSSTKSYQQVKTQIQQIQTNLRNNELEKAERFAKELVASQVDRGDSSFAALSLCQISEYAKKLEKYDLQLKWALEATEVWPDDIRTYGHLADAYLQNERLEDARISFNKCLEGGSDSREYGLSGLARIERSLCNYEEGIKYIDLAISESIAGNNALAIRAELLRDAGKLEQALEAYQHLVTLSPDLFSHLCGLASVFTDLRRFKEAEEIYKEALSLQHSTSDQVVALSGLGTLLSRQGRFREAHDKLDQCISFGNYENYIPHIIKAKTYRLEGKFKEAEQLLLASYSNKDHFIGISLSLIELYIDNFHLNKANKQIDLSKKKHGKDEELLLLESRVLMKNAKYGEALSILETIKANKPKMITALLERADILKISGNFKEAKKQYEEILIINPSERRASSGLKLIIELTGQEQAREISSNFYDNSTPSTIEDFAQAGVDGLILLSKGKTKEAKKLLLLSYNSGFEPLQNQFGAALSMVKILQKQKASAIKPVKKSTTPISLIQKAIVYGELGNIQYVKRSIDAINHDLSPSSKKVVSLITRKYLNKDEKDKPNYDDIAKEQINSFLLAA